MKNKITKKQIREFLRDELEHNDKWALKALTRIYAFQTTSEQTYEDTHECNDVGFTGVDGEILTSFAKQYEKKGYLSPKQMAIVRKKMKKYWKQILTLTDMHKLVKAMLAKGACTEAQAFMYNLIDS